MRRLWNPFCDVTGFGIKGVWLDGGMDGWMVGWMVGWMDGWMELRCSSPFFWSCVEVSFGVISSCLPSLTALLHILLGRRPSSFRHHSGYSSRPREGNIRIAEFNRIADMRDGKRRSYVGGAVRGVLFCVSMLLHEAVRYNFSSLFFLGMKVFLLSVAPHLTSSHFIPPHTALGPPNQIQ